MKKQLLFAGLSLFLITGFSACKKQSEETKPLREKMIGKWQVTKLEITTGGTTTATEYSANDYMDFKNTETDDFELSLASSRSVGTFTSRIDDSFYLDFPSKDLMCTTNKISQNEFQFTGTVQNSNPKVTETYYLKR